MNQTIETLYLEKQENLWFTFYFLNV